MDFALLSLSQVDLPTIWFVLVAFFFVGYFVLDGFDFGVGMSLPLLGRDDTDRRVMINTIGPVWDLNETWVIVAGAVLFAAFPEWYASLFSGFYLPLLLILLALIARGVSFEYRHQRKHPQWTRTFDRMIIFGSLLPAFLWGLIFANVVRGLPMDEGHNVVASLGDVFNPYALLGGLTLTLLCLVHGAVFIALKTDGEIRGRARRLAGLAGLPTALIAVIFLVWTLRLESFSGQPGPALAAAVGAALALVAALFANALGREGLAFGAMAATIGLAVVTLFLSLFPHVLPSTTGVGGLTIANASSTDYTLTVMLWVALVVTPLVIGYQIWTYWVFRRRLTRDHIPTAAH
ncbi:cytochrome d ubiquinol oxidase subunit II [Nesterenkonia xinjiangensis]|uniref:Cytochrome d ubiquinol oxidase subunit II n=1 Tax=Nesterenkonia xinjiangensis TaxID=225327 RepID=A0A7Z0GLB0_9MICC|nr:cytochrome d ubiquinol oxidase subunit II [Nesterenkonia xinjiangensis]NYJ78107.1 cytochrome d ubiquinol oxidase subunit II [Nesterenkonia xinjiangensis]